MTGGSLCFDKVLSTVASLAKADRLERITNTGDNLTRSYLVEAAKRADTNCAIDHAAFAARMTVTTATKQVSAGRRVRATRLSP
jgi:hypothetical protein